jgi:AcrR family transcriptional regulator
VKQTQSDKAAPKRLKPEERRRQAIDATLACLARDGAQGTGVRQVAREMGVAPSLVSYLFGSRSRLFLAAYETLAERSLEDLAEAIADRALPPRARLEAVVDRALARQWLSDAVIGAYLALWELSRTEPLLRAAFRRFAARRARLMEGVLAEVAAESGRRLDVAMLSAALPIFLDGLWLELGLDPGHIPRKQARTLTWGWLDAVLGSRQEPPAPQRPKETPRRRR